MAMIKTTTIMMKTMVIKGAHHMEGTQVSTKGTSANQVAMALIARDGPVVLMQAEQNTVRDLDHRLHAIEE
jgi:hypothetical protein